VHSWFFVFEIFVSAIARGSASTSAQNLQLIWTMRIEDEFTLFYQFLNSFLALFLSRCSLVQLQVAKTAGVKLIKPAGLSLSRISANRTEILEILCVKLGLTVRFDISLVKTCLKSPTHHGGCGK
jgi:hypothetical protein